MSVQAWWNGITFGVSDKTLRPIQSMSTKRSISYLKRDVNTGRTSSVTEALLNLAELDVHVDFVRHGLQGDPRKAWADFFWSVGDHSTFYLAGRLLMVNELILMSCDASDYLLDPDGEVLSVGLDLHFQEFVYNKETISLVEHSPYILNSMKYHQDFNWTDPYNEVKAAASLGISASEAQKRMPFNPQVKGQLEDRRIYRFDDIHWYNTYFNGSQ